MTLAKKRAAIPRDRDAGKEIVVMLFIMWVVISEDLTVVVFVCGIVCGLWVASCGCKQVVSGARYN